MNEEQLIATLQACYFGDRGAFNKILKEYKQLQTENQQLKEKLNQYENPDDLTLFYMWLDEKAKDKMKKLQSTLEEIREYIEKEVRFVNMQEYYKLLQIIDKGINNENKE